MEATIKGHLEGVRVIDLTAWLAGPFLSMQLAAMGAEVIKIERPGTGDPTRHSVPFAGPQGLRFEGKTPGDLSLTHLKRNRGKKSITLDLKNKRGKEVPCDPVLEIKEVLEDPQLKSRGMIQDLTHPLNVKTGVKTAGFAIRFAELPAEYPGPASFLGRHNNEIYMELLNLSTEEMEKLKKEKVI